MKVLCVAEKPSIAKAVSQILSGGRLDTNGTSIKFIKNYKFTSRFPEWGECDVVFTSVSGHLTEADFDTQWRKWTQCQPVALFQEARIVETIPQGSKSIHDNIVKEARQAGGLFIWTDCDREGEHIGSEIERAAKRGNAGIQVKRARFSNLERGHTHFRSRSLL